MGEVLKGEGLIHSDWAVVWSLMFSDAKHYRLVQGSDSTLLTLLLPRILPIS